MSIRSHLAALITAVAIAIPFAAAADQSATQIRAASKAWDVAYNSRQVDKLMDLYHANAVSMVPGAPANVGRKAIRADFDKFFAGHTAKHKTDIKEIVVSGNIAIERAEYALDIQPKTGKRVTERGKHVVVYRRDGSGVWRVLWEIWNDGQ